LPRRDEKPPVVLVVDKAENDRAAFGSFLEEEGYRVCLAENYKTAMAEFTAHDMDVVFLDTGLSGKSGLDVLREMKGKNHLVPVIMITGAPALDTATEALRLGAYDYIPKPIRKETLLRVAKMAARHKRIVDENEKYRVNLDAIFRSAKDGIVSVDNNLKVIEMNDAVTDICGYIRRVSLGSRFDLLPHRCSLRCLGLLKETLAGRESCDMNNIACEHSLRQGQIVSLSSTPLIDGKGGFRGALLMIRDSTRLSRLEEDLKTREKSCNIVGKSERMLTLYGLIESLAHVDTTVLITGESGTGKELVAEAIHYRGIRRDKPFVKINCSALSENLLESELFGHVKGAFTGAVRNKAGRFEKAHGGTILLDEIGDISPRMQLRLLRILQEGEFERVGESGVRKVDVRVLAATNSDLRQKIKSDEFREDLFYRLKVVEIKLPPLRERKEDIPLLVKSFIDKYNKKFMKNITGISDEVIAAFLAYPWPGNIRELEHVIEYGFILCRDYCKDRVMGLHHLPWELREEREDEAGGAEKDERTLIIEALEKTSWNKAKAARRLGISRSTIHRKISAYKIVEL